MYKGEKIKELLRDRNLLAEDLFGAIYTDGKNYNKSLYSIVNGNPSAKRLEIIADFFEVPIDYFFDRKKSISLKLNQTYDYKKIAEDRLAKIKKLTKDLEDKDLALEFLKEKLKCTGAITGQQEAK